MTVTTTLDRQYFDGDGSNKVFPFNFRFFTNDQIYVSMIAPDGTITPQSLTTNYTLTGALQAGGGTVTMIVAPPLTVPATRVFVQRILPQVQPTSIRNQGKFYPEIHEDAFDRLTMLIQQALAGLANALQLTFSKTGWNFLGYKGINVGAPTQPTDAATKEYVDNSSQGNNSYTDGQMLRTVRGGAGEVLTQLPPAASRANKVMGFDALGQPIGILPATGSGTELAIDLANGVDPAKNVALLGYKPYWGLKRRLDEEKWVQNYVPYDFDFGTQDASPWVQMAIDVSGSVFLPRRIIIDDPVYLSSDKPFIGQGGTYGGTVIYTRTGNTVLNLGSMGSTNHTRITVRGIKFISLNAPTRENYFIRGIGAFMDELSDLSFGDVGGVGNQQNGIYLDGTANHVSNIRAFQQNIEVALPDTTGIAIYQTGVNSFKGLQLETGSRFIAENDRGSSVVGLHMERSSLILKNSTKMAFLGVYAIDGAIEIDDRSAGNDLGAIGGANLRMNDLGMFNKYRESVGSIAGNSAVNFGLDKSYLPLSQIAALWNSPVQAGFKITRTGWHVAVILCKNTAGNGSTGSSQTGTAEVFNSTTSTSLGTKSVTLPNIAGIVTPAGASANSHRTVVMVFQAALNDVIQVRGAIVQSAFVSPVENPNPLMIDGSAWAVPGAPAIAGESYFATPTNCTPSYSAGYKLLTPASGAYSIAQFFTPKTDAPLYGVILKGSWPDGTTFSLKVGQSAHEGSRQGKVAQSQAVKDSDGVKTLVQYVTKRDLMNSAQDRTFVSFGATLSTSSVTISLDMCLIFPIGQS